MNLIWENNLQFLKSQSIVMYEKVKNAEGHTATICTTKNGKKNIRKMFKGKSIFIHSNYDPVVQAQVFSDQVSEEDAADIIILFGMGLGYELREILHKYPGKKYLVVEPDIDILKIMLEQVELQSFIVKSHDFSIVITDSPESIISSINGLMISGATTNVKIISLAPYRLIYEHLFEQICVGLHKSINMFRVNVATTAAFDQQWVLNYAVNTRALSTTHPFEQLREVIPGMPVIIVGAGPSLEYNLEHLRKVYNHAIIVAAGSGISVLNNNAIRAHFAGAMDFGEGEMKVFENMDSNKNIALLYSSQVYNGVPRLVSGPKFLLNQVPMDIYIAKALGWEYTDRFSGPSITNVLVHHFAALGCSPIIMLGQDLCYSNDRNYARGAAYYQENEVSKKDTFKKVTNKMGKEVYTTNSFLAMQYAMEQCTKKFPQIEFLNGSKDGLCIRGAQDIDFNEYVEKVLLKSPAHDIEKIIHCAVNQNVNDNMEQKVMDFVLNMKDEILQLSTLSRDCINLIDSDKKPKVKEQQVRDKQKKVEANNFYHEVIWPSSGPTWDIMYKDRKYMDRMKVIHENILGKCNLMLDALNHVYKPILDISEDEMN